MQKSNAHAAVQCMSTRCNANIHICAQTSGVLETETVATQFAVNHLWKLCDNMTGKDSRMMVTDGSFWLRLCSLLQFCFHLWLLSKCFDYIRTDSFVCAVTKVMQQHWGQIETEINGQVRKTGRAGRARRSLTWVQDECWKWSEVEAVPILGCLEPEFSTCRCLRVHRHQERSGESREWAATERRQDQS